MAPFGRLKSPKEFSDVFRRGRAVGDRNLVLFVRRSSDGEAKVGFAVQRKAGTAVKRNRIRRRLRALHQSFEDELVQCAQIVWLGKSGVLTADWQSLRKSGQKLLLRAECLKVQSRGGQDG